VRPRHSLVTIHGGDELWTSVADVYRQVGVYTGRILKGEKPAELPVQQSTKVEFVVNLKTAKMLGLAFPVCTENFIAY
jgi:ABC-type uncharacterized transport system substrate-binding protein